MFIIKSLSRKANKNAVGQLVKYVLRYTTREKPDFESLRLATEQTKVLLRHNLHRARKVDGYIREFEENEKFRIVHRRDSTALYHFIISYDPQLKGKVSTTVLRESAKEFIRLRGENVLSLAVAHLEKQPHIHLIVSGVQTNGRSSRISKSQFASIKNELERFHHRQFPLLTLESSNKKRQKDVRDELIRKAKSNRQTTKEKLTTTLETTYKSSTSKKDFLEKLQEQHLEPYYRGGMLQGIIADEIKYRFNKLGYDGQSLEALDQQLKPKEEAELENLQQIREKGVMDRQLIEQAQVPVSTPIAPEVALESQVLSQEKQLMDDMAALRSGEAERLTLLGNDSQPMGEEEQLLDSIRRNSKEMDLNRDDRLLEMR